jgi:Holliday junction resolvase RusA-like endonuclease
MSTKEERDKRFFDNFKLRGLEIEGIEIHRVVLGEPKAQPRHRHFQRGDFVTTYDPAAKAKQSFAGILQSEAPKEPISAPISLELVFYMARPRNHYGTGKKSDMLKDSAPEYHSGRPDLDNLTKFVQDALNKIYYRDDALICELVARKIYSESPRTEITIKTI